MKVSHPKWVISFLLQEIEPHIANVTTVTHTPRNETTLRKQNHPHTHSHTHTLTHIHMQRINHTVD